MSVDDLLIMISELLVGGVGKSSAHWMKVLGTVATCPISRHTRFNWSIEPRGSVKDVDAAEKAIAFIRKQHPLVDHYDHEKAAQAR